MNRVENRLAAILHRGWWLLLLRGIVAIAFGVLTWFQPGISAAALVLLFGAYAFADGVLSAWTAIAGRADHQYWWLLLLRGLLGIGVGVLAFVEPGVVVLSVLIYMAVWAIATGLIEIVTAIRLRREIEGEWLVIFSGLVSVLFGVVLVILAFKARGFARRVAPA